MKLSEAILLGDSLRGRDPHVFLRQHFEFPSNTPCFKGCAIGGAMLALGNAEEGAWLKLWPWLMDSPSEGIYAGPFQGYERQISDMFLHVCHGSVSLEELVDHVRRMEPQCEDCCRFECTCPKANPLAAEEHVSFLRPAASRHPALAPQHFPAYSLVRRLWPTPFFSRHYHQPETTEVMTCRD